MINIQLFMFNLIFNFLLKCIYYYLFYLLPDSVPFSSPYRLLPIYIGKIPIRGKNLNVFFQLILCVLPSPNLYIFVSFVCLIYYTSWVYRKI